jgi:dTDP-4-amino-4,6-dideoxy-D-galactose acyltransferase
MIEYLAWDSQFFNLKIGRFETSSLRKSDIQKILEQKINQQYNLIYLFAEKLEKKAENEFVKNKIFPIDKRVSFSKLVSFRNALSGQIKLYNGPNTGSLLELAILSGHKSRFKKDPRLSHRFEDLYEQWIKKSITGEMADAVFVAKSDSLIEGFITIKKDEDQGKIGLIAVSPVSQGKGLGTRLMQAADFWCFQNRLKTCSVITQLDNKNACLLYKKNGYKMERIEFVYHL